MFDKYGYKKDYLETRMKESTARSFVKQLFHIFAAVESAYDTDIRDMDNAGISECLSIIEYRDRNHLSNIRTQLGHYMEDNIYFKMFTEESFVSLCQFTPRDYLTIDGLNELEHLINLRLDNPWYYNAILMCTFYGFQINDLYDFVHLKTDDVDFDSNLIQLPSGRTMTMPEQMKKYLRLVIDNNCEYSLARNSHGKTYRGLHENSVFKVQDGNRDSKNSVDIRIRHALRRTAFPAIAGISSQSISSKFVYYSGLLYYLKIRAEENGEQLEDYFNAGKTDSKNTYLQEYIHEFGCSKKASEIKYKFKKIKSMP